MEVPELDFVPLLKPLKRHLWKREVDTQAGRQAAVCVCEESTAVKLDELAVQSNAAFVFLSDPLAQRFVKRWGDGRGLATHRRVDVWR